MKRPLILSSVLGLFGMLGMVAGCAHEDAARGDYHEAKAQRAAEHGNYHRAAVEDRKASRAYDEANHDPLP